MEQPTCPEADSPFQDAGHAVLNPSSNLKESNCHKRWTQGKLRNQIPTVFPRGVCRTVYYVDKDNVHRHFTPGLAPKKKIKPGPNWVAFSGASAPDAADIINNCSEYHSYEEEIGIPDSLA